MDVDRTACDCPLHRQLPGRVAHPLSALEGGKPFALSNGMMSREGVERRAKWRGLMELERLGLVAIERRQRKSPLITVLLKS
jgi:hypothetical protein